MGVCERVEVGLQKAPLKSSTLSLSLGLCLSFSLNPVSVSTSFQAQPQPFASACASASVSVSASAFASQAQSDAGRSPRRHTDTAERWVSPKARCGHGTVLGPAPAVSPPAHRPSRTPGDLLAGIPTPRNDGSPPKFDAGTAQCWVRHQRSPRQHTGLAEQRVSPRRSRRKRRAHDVSTPAQVVPPP